MTAAKPQRWLVTGALGMLGRDLIDILADRGVEATATDQHNLDITDPQATLAGVAGHDVVINAAAWTDVDGAEANEAGATRINGAGVASLAAACAATGARMIHLSTDYIFHGDGTAPYREDAEPNPINAYGRSKLVGEEAVRSLLPATGYVVRTAWLYGARGRNFIATMLRLAVDHDQLTVVDDQHGQPTWSHALAGGLVQLADAAFAGTAPAGTYHLTATGQTTWCGLARAVFAEAGLDPERIRPVTSDQYRRPAARPAYSVLAHDRWGAAGLPLLPHWREQMVAALPSIRASLQPPAAGPPAAR